VRRQELATSSAGEALANIEASNVLEIREDAPLAPVADAPDAADDNGVAAPVPAGARQEQVEPATDGTIEVSPRS
jgi:hypothetical protein